jgi:hypothetical protein
MDLCEKIIQGSFPLALAILLAWFAARRMRSLVTATQPPWRKAV